MEINKKSNRIFYFDIIRAFAIFCIVSCHVLTVYVLNTDIFGTDFWHYSLFLNSLRDLGVPLFVILSGCLLLNKKENFISFAKKRVSRVILPYLFWVFIFILSSLIFRHYGFEFISFSNLNDLIISVFLIKNTAYYFWFVPMILGVYMIIFLINKLNEYNNHILKISLLISVLTIILLNFNIIQFDKPIIYKIFFPVYAVIGYYLANLDFKREKLNSKSLYIIFALIFIISYIYEVSINASMSLTLNQFNCVSQFSWINLISVISLFLFIRYFAQAYELNDYENNRSRYIYSISNCSYGIYLSHIIIYFLMSNVILIHFKYYIPIFIYSTLELIFTFVCSWILIILLNKIPYVKKVSGAS